MRASSIDRLLVHLFVWMCRFRSLCLFTLCFLLFASAFCFCSSPGPENAIRTTRSLSRLQSYIYSVARVFVFVRSSPHLIHSFSLSVSVSVFLLFPVFCFSSSHRFFFSRFRVVSLLISAYDVVCFSCRIDSFCRTSVFVVPSPLPRVSLLTPSRSRAGRAFQFLFFRRVSTPALSTSRNSLKSTEIHCHHLSSPHLTSLFSCLNV